ncbi:excisionase family DNA binding protein [Krasilnikovia cinnamomea]|uniref:Excisionase family DNA binding protein n=1 Tax=Krasilnikovia cinnamomea TaxID=349313 RepID=A0A4Q7Z9T3_9ACTN|nr:helix-turn-helix domain-containing protein [Krasilnikovia cinnamomea]RZU46645.1 excisionase family DNA binding protein [Krasilnikovia cinnamomea]
MPDRPAGIPPLLTTAQLAQRLNLSTKTIYKLAKSGAISAMRAPGTRTAWRFDLATVEQELRANGAASD